MYKCLLPPGGGGGGGGGQQLSKRPLTGYICGLLLVHTGNELDIVTV